MGSSTPPMRTMTMSSLRAHSAFIAAVGMVEAMTDRHEHDLGLAHDLKVLTRRRMFQLAGVAGASALLTACACGASQQAARQRR
jgi:hypothetical protein